MDLKKEKPSKNVQHAQYPARGRGDRQGVTYSNPDGKGSSERIYKSPQFRRAIEDVSSEFQSRTRTDGKKSREVGEESIFPEKKVPKRPKVTSYGDRVPDDYVRRDRRN